MSDFEKLINASDLIEWIMETYPDWCVGTIRSIVDHVESMTPAQPEYHLDEWCIDCKEYDHERHCCPRFNHVIRTTLQEVQAEQPEIVRCKDCKHWVNHKRLNIPWCRELHIDRGAEDFCSMAERRSEDD